MDKSGRVSTIFYLANTILTVISPGGNGNAALYQSVCALKKTNLVFADDFSFASIEIEIVLITSSCCGFKYQNIKVIFMQNCKFQNKT